MLDGVEGGLAEPEEGFAANPVLALRCYLLDEMREKGREGRKDCFKGERIINRMPAEVSGTNVCTQLPPRHRRYFPSAL